MPPAEIRPETWRRVKPGDNIILSDEASILQRMEEGKGPTPESYSVAFIIAVRNKLVEWRLLCINEEAGLYLVAKMVDKALDLYVLSEVEDFPPATRGEMLTDGRAELFFQSPDDEGQKDENGAIKLETLVYMKDFEHTIDGVEVTYLQKPQGELTGEMTFNPVRSGVADWFATVVEYVADGRAGDGELMLIEAGERYHGVVKMLLGRKINNTDTKIMHR